MMQKIKKINLNVLWHTILVINFIAFLSYAFLGDDKDVIVMVFIITLYFIFPILVVIAFIQRKEFFQKIPPYYDSIKKFLKIIAFVGFIPSLYLLISGLFCVACPYHKSDIYDIIIDNILLPIWIFAIIYLVVLKILVLIINLFIKKEI